MPYARPTLSQLRTQVAQDIAAGLPGSDPLLRFSNLAITGTAQANLANLHYGYLDWISLQAVPFTSSGEFLDGWAALKNVFREAAVQAGSITPGQVTFTGAAGTDVPAGTPLVRGDGVGYTTTADAVVVGATVVVSAVANADPTGQTGAFGNCPVGTVMTLGTAIPGIQSNGAVTTAFQNGADIETDDSLMSRMLLAYQSTPQGGASNDYVQWALAVNGVTRAWCNGNGFGAGTVVVYVMLDSTESTHNGFPQGVSGVATAETRGTPTATGDQLTVANYIYPLQPVTALVYVYAPTAAPQNFTITGLTNASAATKAAIAAAIAGVFVQYGTPLGGTIALSLIESSIAAIAGTTGFVITTPAGNITTTLGQLPTVGTITYP
ncbi:baseplate J/gp47 family protein [Paraburkholderia fungorum]|uniref:baseplate J/gp47 family protein n=1 Tax=Paraburkholderia fungorum TaxID=134537 RepID=UPI00161E80A6|nr:baseplate J/gp47 family protein [Paraburkholderia fungorum]MBB5547543.1 putative phage protein gp47/JayE [Paraburkholderia fungorum]